MNEFSGIAPALVEMSWFLGLISLASLSFSALWLLTVNVSCWGSNRLLFIISGGNEKIGRFIAPIPGVVGFCLSLYYGGRAIGFW